MGIAAQHIVQVFDATEERAYRDILHGTSVLPSGLRFIPGTQFLLPLDAIRRCRQVDIHVGSVQFPYPGIQVMPP